MKAHRFKLRDKETREQRAARISASRRDSERSRYRFPLLFALVLVGGATLYTWHLTRNPAGFFIDESSVAYNAYTISQNGQDEFGNSWPLFFRAFGDYKNPVHVYLLAALFKLTGPSILTARMVGAIAGVANALLLGLLAVRVSGRRGVGLLVAASALLTPWLFELSRVAFEVALYPLAVTLFLLCVQRAATKAKWTWLDVGCLTSTLMLLTYTYSIGRLLAPLLALGLVVFATRARWSGILRTWAIYILTLLPMIIFQRRHADALTGRFKLISYIKPDNSAIEIGWQFIKHYLANLNPVKLLVNGDPNIYQVAHTPGTPAMLAATMLLAAIGAWLGRTTSFEERLVAFHSLQSGCVNRSGFTDGRLFSYAASVGAASPAHRVNRARPCMAK